MDLKKYGMSPYIAISLVGILCFLSGIVIAGCNEVGWDPWVNTLSDLGVSDSSLTSSTFNISCYIAGICVFIFGLGLCVFSKDSLQKIGGMSIMVGGCGLFLVGAMTLSNVTMHNIATGLFCIPLVIGIILVTLHHFADTQSFHNEEQYRRTSGNFDPMADIHWCIERDRQHIVCDRLVGDSVPRQPQIQSGCHS